MKGQKCLRMARPGKGCIYRFVRHREQVVEEEEPQKKWTGYEGGGRRGGGQGTEACT